jgi:hypothetical protein
MRCVVLCCAEFPYYFTYRHRLEYNEDRIVRHIEPSLAPHMELHRLSNFNIRFVPTENRSLHLFAAHPIPAADAKAAVTPRAGASAGSTGTSAAASAGARALKPGEYDGRRFFVRLLVRQVESLALNSAAAAAADGGTVLDLDAHPETEYAFVEALHSLEVGIGADTKLWKNNHVFINVMVDSNHNEKYIEAVIRMLARYVPFTQRTCLPPSDCVCCMWCDVIVVDSRYSEKTRRLNVATVEFSINLKAEADSRVRPIRFVCCTPTGHVLDITTYEEKRDPKTGYVVRSSLEAARCTLLAPTYPPLSSTVCCVFCAAKSVSSL